MDEELSDEEWAAKHTPALPTSIIIEEERAAQKLSKWSLLRTLVWIATQSDAERTAYLLAAWRPYTHWSEQAGSIVSRVRFAFGVQPTPDQKLIEALAEGSVVAFGSRNGREEVSTIPPLQWSNLSFANGHAGASGGVAAYMKSAPETGVFWTGLLFEADTVQRAFTASDILPTPPPLGSGQSASPIHSANVRRKKTSPAQAKAIALLRRCFPNGVPDTDVMSHGDLEKRVLDQAAAEKMPNPPSRESILRASGRRSFPAN